MFNDKKAVVGNIIALLANLGVLVPVLIILAIVLGATVFGIPAFIVLLTNPLKMLAILMVLGGGFVFLKTQNLLGLVLLGGGLVILFGQSLGFLAVAGTGIIQPDNVIVTGPSTAELQGVVTLNQNLLNRRDWFQISVDYTGDSFQELSAARCVKREAATAVVSYSNIDFSAELSSQFGDFGRFLAGEPDRSDSDMAIKDFFGTRGGGFRYDIAIHPPVQPMNAGSTVEYTIPLTCAENHGLAIVGEPAVENGGGSVQVFKADNLWHRFLLWYRSLWT